MPFMCRYSNPRITHATKNSTVSYFITSLLLIELVVFYQVVAQIPAVDQVHHEVQILAALEGVDDVYEKRVVQALKQLSLVQH